MPAQQAGSFPRHDHPRAIGGDGAYAVTRQTVHGGFDLPAWSRPPVVRVLIVCDGPISYIGRRKHEDFDNSGTTTSENFALGVMLEDAFDPLRAGHPSWVRFAFTKAHRTTAEGTTPGFENFRFTPGSLDGFDELWLFGHEGIGGEDQELDAGEEHVVGAFMRDGGGVLAMGDHEDMGLALCGKIPRVRTMRKWWYEDPPPPPGMAKAPAEFGDESVHTLVPSADDPEIDAQPQTIYPAYRYGHPLWQPWATKGYPHPILCGPRGAITVLPDHMHEGECIEADLSQFPGEYPGGVAPEVIATGINTAGPEPRPFGVLAVWDGQDPRTGGQSGRVVVESTWHHWFNMNLLALSAEFGDEYLDILAFFRNVGIWLASPHRQTQMRRSALLGAMLLPSTVELTATLRTFRPERFYEIGAAAQRALGHIAPQCQAGRWWSDWLVAETDSALMRAIAPEGDEPARIEPLRAAAIDLVSKTMAGAMFNAVAIRINRARFKSLEKVVEELDEAAADGARLGREAVAAALSRARATLAPAFDAAAPLQADYVPDQPAAPSLED